MAKTFANFLLEATEAFYLQSLTIGKCRVEAFVVASLYFGVCALFAPRHASFCVSWCRTLATFIAYRVRQRSSTLVDLLVRSLW